MKKTFHFVKLLMGMGYVMVLINGIHMKVDAAATVYIPPAFQPSVPSGPASAAISYQYEWACATDGSASCSKSEAHGSSFTDEILTIGGVVQRDRGAVAHFVNEYAYGSCGGGFTSEYDAESISRSGGTYTPNNATRYGAIMDEARAGNWTDSTVTTTGAGWSLTLTTGSSSFSHVSDWCDCDVRFGVAGGSTHYALTLNVAQGATPPNLGTASTMMVSSNICVQDIKQINCGGSAAGDFSADAYYSGGITYGTVSSISGGTAPQAVYQYARGLYYSNSSITYTIPCAISTTYTVNLHFASVYWTASGQEVFDVKINGTTVLNDFDIVAAAGGRYIAVDRTFTASPVSGYITIQIIPEDVDPPFGAFNATINGIEILGQLCP